MPLGRTVAPVLLPVLIASAVMFVAVAARIVHYNGNVTGFVKFGSLFEEFTHPPNGAIIGRRGGFAGYDGQFYYVVARDPLLVHDSTVRSLADAPQNASSSVFGSANQAFRLLRISYPAAAFLVSHAFGFTLAWSLLAINVLVGIALTAGVAHVAWRRGYSPLWGLAVGLLPGVLLATRRDLGDPLATAAALGGLLAWSSGRRTWGVTGLVIAVLAREVMVAIVVGLALDAGLRAWRARDTPGAVRAIIHDVWPAIIFPVLAYAAWWGYVSLRLGGSIGGAGMSLPLTNFVHEVRMLRSSPAGPALWDAAYMVVMIVAVGAAFALLRRQVTALSIAGALLAVSVLVAPFNDGWGNARDSLPLLALLLILGLERRDRTVLGICVAGAVMTAFIPVGFSGPI
jgi:hypothetical protein